MFGAGSSGLIHFVPLGSCLSAPLEVSVCLHPRAWSAGEGGRDEREYRAFLINI